MRMWELPTGAKVHYKDTTGPRWFTIDDGRSLSSYPHVTRDDGLKTRTYFGQEVVQRPDGSYEVVEE